MEHLHVPTKVDKKAKVDKYIRRIKADKPEQILMQMRDVRVQKRVWKASKKWCALCTLLSTIGIILSIFILETTLLSLISSFFFTIYIFFPFFPIYI